MTIETTDPRRTGPTQGNGVTTSFPFDWKVFADTEVQVIELDIATGVETIKTLTTHYTVSLNPDQDADPGGSVVAVVAPTAAVKWTLLSNVTARQPADLITGGGFSPGVIEDQLDRGIILVQQLQESQSRSLLLPPSTEVGVSAQLPSPVALALIGWNSTADGLQNYVGGASAPVSVAMAPVVAAATLPDALALLFSGNVGVGTSAPANRFVVSNNSANGLEFDPVNGPPGGTGVYAYNRQTAAPTPLFVSCSAFTMQTHGTTPVTRFEVSADGNLGLGVSPASGIRCNIKGLGTTPSTVALWLKNSANADLFYVRDDGAFFTGLAATSPYNLTTADAANTTIRSDGFLYRSTSSLRYKKDVQDYGRGLADVLALRPVTYKSKAQGDVAARAKAKKGTLEPVFCGLIAEEVHALGLAEFVQYTDAGEPDALRYGHMVALAFRAIQDLHAQVAELQREIKLTTGNR